MIYLFDYLSQHPLSFQTGVLFLDFDGTLVPLRPTLHEAKLSPSMRHILMGLMVKAAIDMVIVSGRQLKDLKQMVGIDGINLAGNHGMEWEIKGKRDSIQLPAPIHDALGDIITALEPVAEQYKGSILE